MEYFFCYSSSSGKIVTLQKKIVRITADKPPRTSCTSLFTQLEIQPVPMPVYTFFNEFHHQQSGNFSNKFICT